MELQEFLEKLFDEAVKQELTGERSRDIFMKDGNSRDGKTTMQVFLKVLNDEIESAVNTSVEESGAGEDTSDAGK